MNNLSTVVDAVYQQGYCIIDDFLPAEIQQNLYQLAITKHSNGVFAQGKIGLHSSKQPNQAIRRDHILWLDTVENESSIQAYFTAIDAMAQRLNQALFLGLHHFESHFAVYQKGDFYRRHVDQFAKAINRKISCVYYLNPYWHESLGGELKLYNKDNALLETVVPWGNRFICFTSDLPHEVCETQHLRFSIAGWLKTR